MLERLTPDTGFSIDLRAPTSDPIAFSYAIDHFGKYKVLNVTKEKHRGRVSNEAILSDIMEYDVKYKPRVVNDTYTAVLQSVREDFRPDTLLIPSTLGRVMKHSCPKDKSPGLPWKLEGFKTKADVLEDPVASAAIQQKWRVIGNSRSRPNFPDSMVYFRSQICDREENKIRATWGYPLEMIVEEGRFVYPYLAWIRDTKRDVPVAYGVEMALGGMKFIDDAFQRTGGSRAALLDWKRFDKTIPAWLIRDAFAIAKEWFDFTQVEDSEGLVWPVDPREGLLRWKHMVNYFINTPFRLSTGERYRKDGGVPSGSTWTNIIDTIVNAIVIRYGVYHTTGALPNYDIFMGDDSFVLVNNLFHIEEFANFIHDEMGLVLNVQKSYTTMNRLNLQFLGFYNYYGSPVRNQDFLIASFIFPERFHDDPDPRFTAMRALGQLWSTLNCFNAVPWHELLTQLMADYNLQHDWMDYVRVHSKTALKFLKIHGLDYQKVTLPERGTYGIMDVEALRVPRRSPKRKPDTIENYYKRYYSSPLVLEDEDEEVIT